jgi:hypothetical protein
MDTIAHALFYKITPVDGMVLLQKMAKKPANKMTIKDLSKCFNGRLMSLTQDYDELCLKHTGMIL